MSPRYARVTLMLLLVALVPTVVNSYFGSTKDDGPVLAEAVPETIEGVRGRPTNRRDASIRRSFGATDWVERHYSKPDADVTLLVVRSFDMKKLYHHPELGVVDGMEYEPARLEVLESATGRIDIHVLEGTHGGLVAYALLYGNDTVARPLRFQLQIAPELLLRGRRPMTLALVVERAYHRDGPGVMSSFGWDVLRATVAHLRQASAAVSDR